MQFQSEALYRLLQVKAYFAAITDGSKNHLDVLTWSRCSLGWPGLSIPPILTNLTTGWIPYEGAEQLYYLNMVQVGMLISEAFESVYAAQAHREKVITEHLRPSFVPLVQ